MITGLNVYTEDGLKIQMPIIFNDALSLGTYAQNTVRATNIQSDIASLSRGFNSWVDTASTYVEDDDLRSLIHSAYLPENYTDNGKTTLCTNVLTASQNAGIAPQIGTVYFNGATYMPLHFSSGESAGYLTKDRDYYGVMWTRTQSTSNNRIAWTYWQTNAASDSTPRYAICVEVPVFPKNCLVDRQFIPANIDTNTYGAYVKTLRVWCYYTGTTIFGIIYTNYAVSNTSVTVSNLRLLIPGPVEVEVDPLYTDPYTGAGYDPSTAGGGLSSGTFDFTDNGLTDVNTPGIDLLGSGFLTAWNVNKAQLNALANWLWVTTPSQIFQQIYGNPINAVIGLNVVPVAPSIDGGANTIKFGPEDSGVAAPKITSQYVGVDCGTLTIAPVYGSYMDYGPYSSAELFLPYCGGVPLDINDVIGKTISIKYQVDILSGACVAYIFIDGHLHYQKSGCCAGTAPVTGSQMPNVISGVLSIVGSVAGAVASLGASGASTAAKVASGIATGTNVADAATNALKRSISYSGTVSGWAGLLGAQKPYLILTLPNAAIPAGQQQLSGYPAWVGGQLSGFSGHTECANVHLNGLRATDEEMQEIRALLESGVIL